MTHTDSASVMSPESALDLSTSMPTSSLTQAPTSQRMSSLEESQLIADLDGQIMTIWSRYTKRHQPGGYTSHKRLAQGYHHLLQTLLHHQPPAKPFMIVQYLIRIVGDLNEQLPSFPPSEDPRGIFYILKELDDAILKHTESGGDAMSQTERVRLRNELERGRLVVVETFENYKGRYNIEDAIGKVYQRSLEEMEEPFGADTTFGSHPPDEFEDS